MKNRTSSTCYEYQFKSVPVATEGDPNTLVHQDIEPRGLSALKGQSIGPKPIMKPRQL